MLLTEPATTPLRCDSTEELAINTARMLATDQVATAGSGHYGFPLGAGAAMHTLFARHLRFDPTRPDWLNRDRFVLSAGHGSALLYAVLHMAGYDVTKDDLKAFRQWGSKTPGHPERDMTPGVEVTTGPLGQGVANAVGLAIAETYLRAQLGPDVIDHRTWVLASDGDLMEGISYEAVALAGKLRLSRLCVIYDDNDVVIDSRASDAMDSDGVVGMFESLGWNIIGPVDGMDVQALDEAYTAAARETSRPTLIRLKTVIGAGAPLADDPKSHAGAPSDDDLEAIRHTFGLSEYEPFEVPEEVRRWWERRVSEASAGYDTWERRAAQAAPHPLLGDPVELAAAAAAAIDGLEAPTAPEATRESSGKVLDALAPHAPFLIGGSADLAGATFARFSNEGVFGPDSPDGRNIRFGVREHAMGAIVNGITIHSGLRGFGATFLMFATYEANALRMAALQQCGSIHVFSHDSILVGEDGPTHQPVEVTAFLRAIPQMQVLRPADFQETVVAWQLALEAHDRPTCLLLSRSELPQLDHSRRQGDPTDGAYLIVPAEEPEAVLIASGSETHLAVEAAEAASGRRVAVVSVLDLNRFEARSEAELERLAPSAAPRIVVEAGHPMSWYRILRPGDRFVGVTEFGASAPASDIATHYGLTSEHVGNVLAEVLGA